MRELKKTILSAIKPHFNRIYNTEIAEKTKLLTHNLRRITAKFNSYWLVILVFLLGLGSFLLAPPLQQAKLAYLTHPNLTNHLQLTKALIEANNFTAAEIELQKLRTQTGEEQTKTLKQLQRQLINHSPRHIETHIQDWQKLLKEYPNYKWGWVYLAYYQARLGENEAARQSLQKAQNIDFTLEVEKLEQEIN